MEHHTTFVAMDTHKVKISVALAETGRDREVRFLGEIANKPEAIKRLVEKLASRHGELRLCYEAGPLRLWHPPSDHQARAGLHGGGPVAGPDPARRSCQDQPTRRGELGQAAPGGRADRGLGSRGGARGHA